MKRSTRAIDWHSIRCPNCNREFDIDVAVRTWAGDGYPTGTRVVVCSIHCATQWATDHATVPDTLFGGG